MNIFVLNEDPLQAARDHCDKHVVKMVIEYGQLLSTAHRCHDGERTIVELPNGKTKKALLLNGEGYEVVQHQINNPKLKLQRRTVYRVAITNPRCYNATHANHPSAVWARETTSNYSWLFKLFEASLNEYTARYGKRHAAERIVEFLSAPPTHIRSGGLTPFAQAMPEEYKHADAVQAYRRFYAGAKARFAKWRYTEIPTWYTHLVEGYNAAYL